MLDPSPFLLSHLSPRHLFLPWQRPCFKYFASANDNNRTWAFVRTFAQTPRAHSATLLSCAPSIPRRYLLAPPPTCRSPYPRLPLLAPTMPLLPLVCALDRYLSYSLFLCLVSTMVRESRALSCRATSLLASLCASLSPPGSEL